MANNRFNCKFPPKKKRKPIEIKNADFLPTRSEFNSSKQLSDLKKAKEKEIVFYSEDVKKSKYDTGLRFINYISDSKQTDKINGIEKFASNLDLLKKEVTNLDYDERALSVLSLYLGDKITEIAGIVKSDIKTSLNQQDGIRVYWYLDLGKDKLVIICLDPQHLVIPSTHNGKDKETMMHETFNETLNSKKHCISKYFIK